MGDAAKAVEAAGADIARIRAALKQLGVALHEAEEALASVR